MNRLNRFKIEKLFGYQKVELTFNNNIMILMGENGLGKTSILNSLYFSLTQKWKKLQKINFESIELSIDNRPFKFTKDQLTYYIENKGDKRDNKYRILRSEIKSTIDFADLAAFFTERSEDKIDKHRLIYEYVRKNKLDKTFKAPSGLLIELIARLSLEPDLSGLENFIDFIETSPKLNILYFPTYRRVEEELHNLGRLRKLQSDDFNNHLWDITDDDDDEDEDQDLEDETLIQFGMEDVVQRIDKIISNINDSSIKGFAKVTGEMLHQLQEGFPTLSNDEIFGINGNNIEIILNRVKNNLSLSDRRNILELVNTKELLKKQELAYFLIKLEDIYLQQQNLDNSIKQFEKVCNQYLVGKKFIFDESSVTLNIFNDRTLDRVELTQLSSGEKQIVSLFSKLYLEEEQNLLVFFDEPELSLSIKWQKQLLPHVLGTNKCDFLLAVTHSPFIFSNELEKYAVGMNLFID